MKSDVPFGFKIVNANPSFGFIINALFPESDSGVVCFELGPNLRSDLDDSEYEIIEKNKSSYSNFGGKLKFSVFKPFLNKMRSGSDLALFFSSEKPSSLQLKDGEWDLAHHCYDDTWSELFTHSEEVAKRIRNTFDVISIKFPGSINTPGGVQVPLE